jgi:putative NADH-flavin reductase
MRILVLGANGRTGRHVVSLALAAGHRVTAFVRRADGLPTTGRSGPDIVLGDVRADQDLLAGALAGHDAVIGALGNGLALRDGRAPKIVGAATNRLVAAMTRAGVPRLVTMLSYGAGATAPHAPLLVRALAATAMRADFADLAAADRVLAASDLAWTVAHFGALTDADRRGAAITTRLTRPRRFRIGRADVAACLLRLAATDATVRRRVVLDGDPRPGPERLIVPAEDAR